MKKRIQKPISDKELGRLLSSLREDIAAPAGFRSKIIAKLAIETGQAPAQPSRATQWLRGLLSPAPAFAFAAAAVALGFGIYVAVQPAPLEVEAHSVAAAKPAAPRLAMHRAKPAKELPLIETASGGQSQGSLSVGHDAAPSPAKSSQVGAVASASPQPTVVVVHPTATPIKNGLQTESQVRGNKIRASEHGYAAILFNLKAGGHVRIEIYNRLGRLEAVPLDEERPSGVNEIHWYGHDSKGDMLPTGIYLIRIKTAEYDQRHKAVLVR